MKGGNEFSLPQIFTKVTAKFYVLAKSMVVIWYRPTVSCLYCMRMEVTAGKADILKKDLIKSAKLPEEATFYYVHEIDYIYTSMIT